MSPPRKKPAVKKPALPAVATEPGALAAEIRQMIEAARHQVAQVVNAGLTMLYWQIGTRIRQDILKKKRAGYGEKIVHALSAQLTLEFGRGFTSRNLFNMIRFSEVFPDSEIVASLIRQLGWTHLLHIIQIDDPLKCDFYAEMCGVERWSGGWPRPARSSRE